VVTIDISYGVFGMKCKDVIACWGSFKQAEERIKVVLPKFPEALCFGVTANN
jgi:hypothetical protein